MITRPVHSGSTDPVDAIENAAKLYDNYVRVAQLAAMHTPPAPVHHFPTNSNQTAFTPPLNLGEHAVLERVTA